MKKKPRYVLLRSTKHGEFYAQFIAANGKEVWRTSETYKRRGGVRKAIDLMNSDVYAIEDLTKK
jgi:uncharacterized protein YegP (UPF0339 family)